jgi:CO dehydrogenase maturation factor
MLGDILSERNDLTVADMEAGIEHLSRSDGTLRHVDILLIVLEPYRKALETARRTLSLASDLGIEKIYGVASKVEDPEDAEIVREFAAELGLEMLATLMTMRYASPTARVSRSSISTRRARQS